jgi:hypothetical protein
MRLPLPWLVDSQAASTRLRAGFQMAYALLLAGFVIVPNLRSTPSLVLVVAAVLALVWVLGCIGLVSRVPRSDELVLCGAAAPVVLGLTQLTYRLNFLGMEGFSGERQMGSVAGFLSVWIAELVFVLAPGVFFVVWNVRNLSAPPAGHPRRPSRTNRRT